MQALQTQSRTEARILPRILYSMAFFFTLNAPVYASIIEVLPPHSSVAGKTIGEWTAEWWKWAYSISLPNDPFSDSTGAYAGRNQSGPVFFLAQSPGTNLSRSITVPSGKYLLVPLIAGEWSQAELGFDKTVAELQQAAKDDADLFYDLELTLDGVSVSIPFSL